MVKATTSFLITFAAIALWLSTPASAGVITSTLPEFTGTFEDPADTTIVYPLAPVLIGTFTYTIPTGSTITGATISGTFGAADTVDSTALSTYFVNSGSIQVAACTDPSADCFNGPTNFIPVPWTYTFKPAQLAALASGSLDFTVVQLGGGTIETGVTELDITTVSPTPEPATAALILIGGAGFYLARCSRKRL